MAFIKLVSETKFENGDVLNKYADGSYCLYDPCGYRKESYINGNVEIYSEEQVFDWYEEDGFGVSKTVKVVEYVFNDGSMTKTVDGMMTMKRQANGCFAIYGRDGRLYELNERPIGGPFKRYYPSGELQMIATDNGWTEYDRDGNVTAQEINE